MNCRDGIFNIAITIKYLLATALFLTFLFLATKQVEASKVILSMELQSYIKKVEEITGRSVRIIESPREFAQSGMSGAFQADENFIVVKIKNRAIHNFEHVVAHEITHGRLMYERGYCELRPTKLALPDDGRSASIIATMIEDIVVIKTLQDEGFQPFSKSYLRVLEKETEAARNGEDFYKEYNGHSLLKDRFIVSRYVFAWGILKYCALDDQSRKIISIYEKSFQRLHSKQYQMAKQIKKIILCNNIFTSDGYNKAIKETLYLWNLQDKFDIRVYK